MKRVVLSILFLIIQSGTALLLPYTMAQIVELGISTGNLNYILQQGAVMIAFAVISFIAALLNNYMASQIAYEFGQNLREYVYKTVLHFTKNQYDSFETSSLITRTTSDVTQVQELVEMGLKFLILAPIYLIGGISLTFLLSKRLALVFVGFLPVLILSVLIFQKYAQPLYSKVQSLLDRMNLLFREGLNGTRTLRVFRSEDQHTQKYKQVSNDYATTSVTALTIMGAMVPFIFLLLSIATLFIIWVGAKGVSVGSIQVGSIMGAVSYASQISIGFILLTNAILSVPKSRVSMERIDEIIQHKNQPFPLDKSDFNNAGLLHLDSLSFQYPQNQHPTLENISLTVKRGETLAVVGGTGSGKTTLVQLLAGLYPATTGTIRVKNSTTKPLTEQELQSVTSYNPQKSTLFMGTIRENLLMGNPNATDDELWAALTAAQGDSFVKALDKELDSWVEWGGTNFSGGQRQRLCIARTILKPADIYIFDDSFSALDYKTDAAVRLGIAPILKNAVTVIVAQRISSVRNVEYIAVLEQGRLDGFGSHDQLMKTSTVYQELVESQTDKEVPA